jgi:glucose-6-phosphate 1-dehydrogenase
MSAEPGPGPCHFVIFGATGHLARTKLLPALFHLHCAGRIGAGMAIVAMGRRPWSLDEWLGHLREALTASGVDADGADFEAFARRFDYVQGDLRDAATYRRLFETLSRPRPGACENIVFYLSVRPEDFLPVVDQLDRAGLSQAHGRHRIVVEKPFGRDLQSAAALNRELHQHFDEEQVFRIDHYLGKETVQNLTVLRFANTLIEPIWNRNYIDHVQITVAESDGIGTRAGYFDSSGTLRDMLQNHLLQLVAAIAMEPPARLSSRDRRDEKVKVFRSIRPLGEADVLHGAVRGQYTGGRVHGAEVPAYVEEDGVPAGSRTETYVALRLLIDNWRWRNVPFYLRTGKRLVAKSSVIAIRFRVPPQQLFHATPMEHIDSNWITLMLQPDECIEIQLYAKQPGLELEPRVVRLNTRYRNDGEPSGDAYETLLLDVIEDDRSLFIRFDEVEECWGIVEPLLDAWAADRVPLATYPAGSAGPAEADRLALRPEHRWRDWTPR